MSSASIRSRLQRLEPLHTIEKSVRNRECSVEYPSSEEGADRFAVFVGVLLYLRSADGSEGRVLRSRTARR